MGREPLAGLHQLNTSTRALSAAFELTTAAQVRWAMAYLAAKRLEEAGVPLPLRRCPPREFGQR